MNEALHQRERVGARSKKLEAAVMGTDDYQFAPVRAEGKLLYFQRFRAKLSPRGANPYNCFLVMESKIPILTNRHCKFNFSFNFSPFRFVAFYLFFSDRTISYPI